MNPPAPGQVKVSRRVLEGIEAVRESGLTNMLDWRVVIELAEGMGYAESARWLRENKALYGRAIFMGFEVVDEGDQG